MDRQQATYLIRLNTVLQRRLLNDVSYDTDYLGKPSTISELVHQYIDAGVPLHYVVGMSHQRLTALISSGYKPIVLLDKGAVCCSHFETTQGGLALVQVFSGNSIMPFYLVYRDLLLQGGWCLSCYQDPPPLSEMAKLPSKLSVIFAEKQND